MMKMTHYAPTLPFAMTALCLLLTACGGGSNNIATGGGNGGVTSNLCASNDTNCVDIVFDDTPVANLNFECGVYYGVTGNTAVARCPLNSTVKFFIKPTNSARRVNLGEYLVKPVRTTDASEALDTSLIRITVKDLAEGINGTSIGSLDDESAKTAINLSRFIQSIGLKSEPYIQSAPVNRIFVDKDLVNGTAAKAATATSAAVAAIPGLEILTADVDAKDFKDGTFATKLSPWLTAHNRSLISADEAKSRLQKTILAVKSGLYFGTPAQRLTIGNNDTENDFDLGISGTGSINTAIQVTNAIYALNGRDGVSTGYGMQWASDAPKTSAEIFKLFVSNKFAKMRVIGGGVNPFTGRFRDFSLQVSKAQFVGDTDSGYAAVSDNGTSTLYEDTFGKGDIFSFVNGKLQRDLVIVGTRAAYKKYTEKELTDVSELGTWEQKTDPNTTSGARIYNGRATLYKIAAINTYLDPKVWRVKELVATGQNYVFPLYATLTFNYSDSYKETCKPQNTPACPISRKLSVVFLENGDIWTSFNSTETQCVAPVTGKDVRIGTVRAAFLNQAATQYYISPTIILSGRSFGALDGVQIGTSALAPRVKINLAGVINASKGTPGSVNVTSAEPVLDSNGNVVIDGLNNQSDAVWANGYNSLIASFVANAQAEVDADDPKKPTKTPPPAALKLAATQSAGVLTIAPSPCYVVQAK